MAHFSPDYSGEEMAEYFNEADISNLLIGYEKKIISLKSVTFNQYRDIIGDFLRSIVLNKIEKYNYESFFSEDNISRFRKLRKSIIVRSALNKFLAYLISEGKINKGFEFEFPNTIKEKINNEFLTLEEIKYIFNDAEFESREEKLISRAICALACFCFFEQKHINALQLNDVLVESGLVRNLRATDDDNDSTAHLLKWLRLNDVSQKCINDYLKNYRLLLKTDQQDFFIYQDKPLSNNANGINSFLAPYERKVNRDKVKKVHVQLLYSSTLLYWLTSTQGKALSKILQIIEAGNQQWKKAFRYYMENYASLDNSEGVMNIDDFNVIEIKHSKEESRFDEEPEEDPGEVESNLFIDLLLYSEEGDIGLNDLIDFDSMSNSNLEDSEININRLVRDTTISRKLKRLYDNKCQLCSNKLRSANGSFMSEAHHIQPYNRTHKGDDTFRNLITLCPNCHAQFDQLYYAIDPDTLKVHCLFEEDRNHLVNLEMIDGHVFDRKYLEYTWRLFEQKKANI
ncbi:HNH endonuclease [Desulfitobacterium dichloroeliminans]|nr:HNH endonuclease [Desulfitobacterium dichloroeliminans]